MPPIRFAHMADLHLDSPFRGLGATAPALQAALADASLHAWDRAVDICLAERVDFALIAGDVYEQEEAGVRAQLRFLRGLERLSAAAVPVFVVHGNHDPEGGRWPAIGRWPPGVTVFGSAAVEAAPVEKDGRAVALVHGISYPERHVRANLAARFRRSERPGDASLYQVGLLHATVGEQGEHPEHARYAPCGLDDLRRSGLDYWALGHVHTRQVISADAPCAVYPGNLQARHPGEEGPRGLYLVEAEPGGPARLTFHASDLWRFATVRLDLGRAPAASVDEVVARLQAGAEEARADRGLIATAEVAGPSPLHPALSRPGVRDELLRQLRDDAAGAAELWWDGLRLRTRPPHDRAGRMEAADFVADVLRAAEAGRPAARGRVAALLAELRGRADLAARRDALDWTALEEAAGDLWSEAEQTAFDLLEAEAAPGGPP